MSNIDLIYECKIGLGISIESVAFDQLLNQKIAMVKAYLLGAGVSESKLTNDLAIGVIVMGVTDLWEMQGGDVRFSPVFHTLVTQLACGGEVT
jgi:hypothetical protein